MACGMSRSTLKSAFPKAMSSAPALAMPGLAGRSRTRGAITGVMQVRACGLANGQGVCPAHDVLVLFLPAMRLLLHRACKR